MSEEEFFNAMDMDMDLSFLHPADSPHSTTNTECPNEMSSDDGEVAHSSTTPLNARDDHTICEPTIPHSIEAPQKSPLVQYPHLSTTLSHSGKQTTVTSSTAIATVPTKSLAAWTFNKKKRKRIYISLTGQKLTGPEAIRQCREGILLGHCFSH